MAVKRAVRAEHRNRASKRKKVKNAKNKFLKKEKNCVKKRGEGRGDVR
jgi:hypothetical protein